MKDSLNHIYRTIWSGALNAWVTVSELASAKGQRSGASILKASIAACEMSFKPNCKSRLKPIVLMELLAIRLSPQAVKSLVMAVACCYALNTQANPIGAQVINGTAATSQSGNTLTVTNSPNAIINWQNFSINTGETTRFVQQSASSSVLNRVTGADPSALLGTLASNGKVFLINPAGILVGQGARIDVAGFVASTLNLSNSNFLAGNLNFDATPNAGAIRNNGAITTPEGGTVYLVAPQVENQGIITTPRGETILAAGNTVQLMDTGTPGVTVQVTGTDNSATNLGQILADSGRIGMVGAAVRNSGTLNASSLVNEGGRVFLRAGNRVEAGGTIAANGTKGGTIEVFGNEAGVMDGATLSANGTQGGGTVLVGGDYQGKNPAVQNAQITYFAPTASISADATDTGDGGKVIVWADGTTRAYGSISARGGINGGNGGFVETSGHNYLDVTQAPNLTAPHGNGGTWLLDPYDIIIGATDTPATYTGSPNFVGAGGVSPSYIGASIIAGILDLGSNVIVDTTGAGGGAGNITINASITTTTASVATLTLKANNDISIEAPLNMNNSLVLTANQDVTGGGSVFIYKTVAATGAAGIIASGQDIVFGSLDSGSTSGQFSGNSVNLTAANVITPSPWGAAVEAVTPSLTLNAVNGIATGGKMFVGNVAGTIDFTNTNNPVNIYNISAAPGRIFTGFNTNGAVRLDSFDSTYATTVDNLTAGGNVVLRMNNLVIGATGINANANTVYLSPYSNSPVPSISIGGTNTFNLTGAEISNITAGKIVIGNDSFGNTAPTTTIAGTTTITNGANLEIWGDAISMLTAGSFSNGLGAVKLVAGAGGINNNSGSGVLITTDILEVVSAATVMLGGNNIVNTFAANVTSGTLTFENSASTGMTIGTAGLTSGVAALGDIVIRQYTSGSILTTQNIVSSAGNVLLGVASGAGGITTGAIVSGINTQVYTSGGNILVNAGLTAASGTAALYSGAGSITTGTGQINANTIVLQSSGGSGNIGTSATSPLKTSSIGGTGNANISIGYAIGPAGPGAVYLDHIGDATLQQVITTGAGTPIDISASGNLTVASTINTGAAGLSLSAGNLLAVNAALTGANIYLAADTVTQNASGIINATNMAIMAVGNVSLTTAANNVTNLAAEVTGGAGNFSFKNAGALNIGAGIDGLSGISMLGFVSPDGLIALISGGALTQSAGALLAGSAVYAEGSRVILTEANPTGVIAGKTTGAATGDIFSYTSNNGIYVTTVNGFAGIQTLAPPDPFSVVLNAGVAGIGQDAPINAGTGTKGLSLTTTGPVLLDNLGNNVSTLTATGFSDLSFYNSGALNIGTNLSTPLGNIDLTSGAALNIGAQVDAGGYINLAAGAALGLTGTSVISDGNMNVDVGGNLTLTATSSQALLKSGGTQKINFTGTGTHLMNIYGGTSTNGSNGAGDFASIESSGLQTISYAGTLNITLTGGNITANTLSATNNLNVTFCTSCGTFNSATIRSDGGQDINASTITINGGSGGNGNYASIENKNTNAAQSIMTTGFINLNGGTGVGYSTANNSVTNEASIHSDGTQTIGTQANPVGSINLLGGGDINTLGGAFLTGKLGQDIWTTGNMVVTGGASTVNTGQYGIGAPAVIGEEFAANITLHIGGNLTMTGGTGLASPALIGSAQGIPNIDITAGTGIFMLDGGSSSRIGVLTGGPAGALLMTATTGNISQGTSSYINTDSFSVFANAGLINLAGPNLVNTVTALSASGTIGYVSAQSVHIDSATSTTGGATIISTLGDIGLGVLDAAGTATVTADGAIYDDNGSGIINIMAPNIYLTSNNGGLPSQLAISADTQVAAGGIISAIVNGGSYGGIRIQNNGINGTPGTVSLADYSASGAITFTNVGDIGSGTSISATTGYGDIAILVDGSMNGIGGIVASTPSSALIGATVDMSVSSSISNPSGSLGLVAGNILDISGSVYSAGDLALVAPTTSITGGSAGTGGSAVVIADSLTITNGLLSAANTVSAYISGDVRINATNSSSIFATNGVYFAMAGAASTIYFNDPATTYTGFATVESTSPAVIQVDFQARSGGGVIIDGVDTLTTTNSGFYNSGLPADLGMGLIVNYFDLSQVILGLVPPPSDIASGLPTIDQFTAPLVDTSLGGGGGGTGALDLSGGGIGGTSDTFGGEGSTSTEGNGKDDKDKGKGKKDEKPGKC